MARLFVIEGEEKGRAYELGAVTCIGRLKSNEIMVKDAKTSRQNTRILIEGGVHFVEDLNSSNGTYVNNSRIEKKTPLKPGDLLKIGLVVFKYDSGTQPPREQTPAAPAKPASPAKTGAARPAPVPESASPAQQSARDAKPAPQASPAPSIASMATPPAGTAAEPARRVEIASMPTPSAGTSAPVAAREDVDELVLEDPAQGTLPAPSTAQPQAPPASPPAASPPLRSKPAARQGAYEITLRPSAGAGKRSGVMSEDVGQRDWRYQLAIAAGAVVLMAALFYAMYKVSTSL